MDWRDDGFVLAARRHGENSLIVELLTRAHGRRAGLVRGGQSPRRRALLQVGNLVAAAWRGRLPEHLGTLDCELVRAHAALLLDDADRLAALGAAAALLTAAVPEHEPHPEIYNSLAALLALLTADRTSAAAVTPSPLMGEGRGGGAVSGLQDGRPDNAARSPPPNPPPSRGRAPQTGLTDSADAVITWAQAYVAWECDLLAALGFGLDLARCAATGTNQDLAYVSPRSGRAVSREAGRPYHDKLLPLPGFLWREVPAERADIVAGLALTRHFLVHHVLAPSGGKLPEARDRLADRMRRATLTGIIGSDSNEVL